MSQITDAEIARLRATKNEDEWNAACTDIKKVRGGAYPDDWWAKVKLSGLIQEVTTSWGKPELAEIRITAG